MITFKDIMTRGIIYYDDEYREECKNFCKTRKIGFLPHISDSHTCYRYNSDNNNFHKESIKEDQFVTMGDDIYDFSLRERFQKYHVLFVKKANRIAGVAHYSDYNRSPVYEDIYKKLFLLERGLLHLVIEYSGLKKQDVAAFAGNESNEENRSIPLRRKDFRGKGNSLKFILEFVQTYELLKIRPEDIKLIMAVRNKIAHSDSLVLVNGDSNEKLAYQINSFVHLLKGVKALEVALRQLSNRLYFMEATLEEDFSLSVVPIEDYLFK